MSNSNKSSKLSKAFSAVAKNAKENFVFNAFLTGASGAVGYGVFIALGGSLAATPVAPLVVLAVIGTFGRGAVKAARRAYKNG